MIPLEAQNQSEVCPHGTSENGQHPGEFPASAKGWPVHSWVNALDPLRGAAALAVVVCHAVQQSGLAWLPVAGPILLWLGAWGVALFFVLSGFCIHLPQAACSADERTTDFRRFYRRRARRLLPTHYAALLLSALTGMFVQTAWITRPTFMTLATHIFMVHVWTSGFYSINAVFWTIAVEIQFYICYPVYLWLRSRFGSLGTVAILFGCGLAIYGVAATLLTGTGRMIGERLFLVSWWEWALGALLADLYVKGRRCVLSAPLTFRGAPLFWLISSLLLGSLNPRSTIFHLHWCEWAVAGCCGALLGSLVVRTVPEWPMLAYVGIFSYSIYLMHPVIFALLVATPIFARVPQVVEVVALIVVGVGGCWFFYLVVERHFVSNRMRQSR